MKKSVLCSVFVTLIIPTLIFMFLTRQSRYSDQQITNNGKDNVLDQEQIDYIDSNEITLLTDQGVKCIDLEEYILGVVLGEMPVDFEPAALMAQSVVARTYTCKSINRSKHDTADVCVESSCCQAYLAPELFLESGGNLTTLYKVKQAVEDTEGQVLMYQGELIEATYFSCSGGRTEAAYAVWGGDVPYLQAVDSPGEEGAKYFTDTVQFSVEEFCRKLNISNSLEVDTWVKNIKYTAGGGIDAITINGCIFSGTEIRRLLNLRSTAFVISVIGDTVTVTTKGYGHRVGMSQYGAEAMAVQGSTYKEILEHYYPGTELSSCQVDKDS